MEVSVPYVVSEEWRTQQVKKAMELARRGRKSIQALLVGGFVDSEQQVESLKKAVVELIELENSADEKSQVLAARLMDELNANSLPLAASHGQKVMESYFNGSEPFSAIKAKKDIPDAFIFAAIEDLIEANPHNQVTAVTADKKLCEGLVGLSINCHESLVDFVQSSQVAEVITHLKQEANWQKQFEKVIQFFSQKPDGVEVLFSMNAFVDLVAGSEVNHPSLPSDNHDASISQVDDAENIDYQWDMAESYGPGIIRVSFTCETEVLLDFSVYQADAYGLSDKFSVQYTGAGYRHYFDVQAYATAKVTGYAVATISGWEQGLEQIATEVVVDEISEIELQENDGGNALY